MLRYVTRDSSWITQFKEDVKTTGFYSITMWVKPTSGSKGMPRFFFPHFRFMSRLARPFTWLTTSEVKPRVEDQLNFLEKKFMFNPHFRFTANTDYRDWTMYYFSMELKDNEWTKCVTLNANPLTCYKETAKATETSAEGPLQLQPEELMEAVEVYTEVLMAPIEFTAQKESSSQLQKRFYKRKAELEKIKGPSSSEKDRTAALDRTLEKEVLSYDEKIGLVSPPLLFQTRLQTSSCNKAVADPFLLSQLTLVNSSHCTTPGMCPGVNSPESMMQCAGEEASLESFFGLNTSTLNGEEGFADYLFTYSDNPIVVRGGATLPTRNFFDSKTLEGKVVASFVSPGLDYALQVGCV